jgi:hypothetical protein
MGVGEKVKEKVAGLRRRTYKEKCTKQGLYSVDTEGIEK